MPALSHRLIIHPTEHQACSIEGGVTALYCINKLNAEASKSSCVCRDGGNQQGAIQSISAAPDTDDAKSERIRQLHHTLSALIDERDDLLDHVDSLSQSELVAELESAHSEIQWLRVQVESTPSDQNSFRSDADLL